MKCDFHIDFDVTTLVALFKVFLIYAFPFAVCFCKCLMLLYI